jgi:hypothetical protein
MHSVLTSILSGRKDIVYSAQTYLTHDQWMQTLLPSTPSADFVPNVEVPPTYSMTFLEWMLTYNNVLHDPNREYTPLPRIPLPPLPENPREVTKRVFVSDIGVICPSSMTQDIFNLKLNNAVENVHSLLGMYMDHAMRTGADKLDILRNSNLIRARKELEAAEFVEYRRVNEQRVLIQAQNVWIDAQNKRAEDAHISYVKRMRLIEQAATTYRDNPRLHGQRI